MEEQRAALRRKIIVSLVFVVSVMMMLGLTSVVHVFAQQAENAGSAVSTPAISATQAEVMKFGLLAASIAFGLGAIGAGIGIGNVGAAAMGAISEKPEIAGQALIFVALAEGLVVFGFITALIILGRV